MTNDYSTEADTVGDALDAIFLKKNQGSANQGKYLKVDTDGSVICATGGGGGSATTLTVTNSTSLPNLGGTYATQDAINRAIDSQIGTAIAYINL